MIRPRSSSSCPWLTSTPGWRKAPAVGGGDGGSPASLAAATSTATAASTVATGAPSLSPGAPPVPGLAGAASTDDGRLGGVVPHAASETSNKKTTGALPTTPG